MKRRKAKPTKKLLTPPPDDAWAWWILLLVIVAFAVFGGFLFANQGDRIEAVEGLTKTTERRADVLDLKVEALRSRVTQAEDRLPIVGPGRVELPDGRGRVR